MTGLGIYIISILIFAFWFKVLKSSSYYNKYKNHEFVKNFKFKLWQIILIIIIALIPVINSITAIIISLIISLWYSDDHYVDNRCCVIEFNHNTIFNKLIKLLNKEI